MSAENVETVRRLFEAFERGDFDAALALVDAKVEWDEPPDMPDTGGTYHGHTGMVAGFRRFLGAWEELRVEPEEVIDAPPDRVVVTTHWVGRSRRAGIEVDQRVAQVYELRDGKVLRLRQFREREDALRAASVRH